MISDLEGEWPALRARYRELTGKDLEASLNSPQARKARWRTFGAVRSAHQRQALIARVTRDRDETIVAIHARRMLRAEMRLPGGHEEILAHARASNALGRLAR